MLSLSARRWSRAAAQVGAKRALSEGPKRVHHPGHAAGMLAAEASLAAEQAAEEALRRKPAPPTRVQLRLLFTNRAVPMVGFGIVDQLVMISCGDLIDSTLGVRFGLATLTAAAFGQVFSDVSGVCFGGVVEGLATKLGLRQPDLSPAQRTLPLVRRVATAGAACGVVCGCLMGMSLLLVLDTTAKERDKKQREMETIFKTIMDHSHDLIGAEWCSLFFVDEAKGELWSKVATDRDGNVSTGKKLITVPLSAPSIAGEVVRTQKIINVQDCYKDERFYKKVDDKMQMRTTNLLAVPVFNERGSVVAVIEMMNKRSGAFSATDEKLCTMLAHHVSVFLRQLETDS